MAHGTILFVCNVGWFFISHRLELAKAALTEGYEVHVACDIDDAKEAAVILEAGVILHRLRLSRGGIDPVADLRTFVSLAHLAHKLKPAIVHNITIKPVLYGSIAARLVRVSRIVNSVSGLGYVFIDAARAGIAGRIARFLYRFALRSDSVRVIFQNADDRSLFIAQRFIRSDQAVLIAGAGVDLEHFRASDELEGRVKVVLPARMLADKGVREFFQAASALTDRGCEADFLLAGAIDLANPASITTAELEAMVRTGSVKWLGHVADMRGLLEQSHIVCLPSYREGLPKALIEACAAGRAIVTTDVPGCRDVVDHGVNGLLVPAQDAAALTGALASLIEDRESRRRMGLNARRIAEAKFGLEEILGKTLDTYRGQSLSPPSGTS